MLNKEKIKKFILENKWIIAASIFFIVWKFFLIGVMWHDRLSPPEPDDSYVYTGYIYSVKECPKLICEYPSISMKNFTGYTYLSYRIIFGTIAKILNISPLTLYHFSFYLGITLLLPILILFIGKFTENKNLLAFSLFFFALYNGGGSYHGLFWVVPSFFSILLFFLIFYLMLSPLKNWWNYLILVVPIFIYMHDLSIYLIGILIIYFFLYSFFSKSFDKNIFKKVLFITILSILIYAPSEIYLQKNQSTHPRGIVNIFKTIKNKTLLLITPDLEKGKPTTKNISESSNIKKVDENKNIKEDATCSISTNKSKIDKLFPGLKEFSNSYLKFLFPNIIGVMIFSFFLFLVTYYKNFKILSLFLSSFVFVLTSLSVKYGERSLIILWPTTFLFYSFGFWHTLNIIKKINSKKIYHFSKLATYLILLVFISFNFIYSYKIASDTNKKNDTQIDENFINFVLENISNDKKIFYTSKELWAYSLNTPLIYYPQASNPQDADYIAYFQKQNVTKKDPAIWEIAFNTVGAMLYKSNTDNKNLCKTSYDLNNREELAEFDNIKIYKKNEIFR